MGKAWRLLKHLDTSIGKICTHGAVENMTEVVRPYYSLPETTLITHDTSKEEIKGNIIIAPPSVHGSTWIRRFVPYVTASVSGWMTFPRCAKKKDN